MNNKVFAGTDTIIETPNESSNTEKPLKSSIKSTGRVDINILKSKLRDTETKQFKKNLLVLSTLIFLLGSLGIYLSL